MDYLTRLLSNVRRDKQIKLLRSRGWTLQRIADKYKITRERVRQIARTQ